MEGVVSLGQKTRRSAALLPVGMILLQSVLYGFGDPISKAAYETTPLFTLLTLRYCMAFAALWLLWGKRVVIHLKTTPVRAWLLPGCAIGLSYVLSNLALTLAPATSVAFLRSLATILTPLLALILYGRRPGWKHVAVQFLTLPGLWLLCGAGGLSRFGAGEAVAILSAVFMAAALVLGQNSLRTVDPITLTTMQSGCSALFALVCALFMEGGVRAGSVTPDVWAVIFYLAIFCTLAGYLLQNKALEKISARSVALLQCLCPVVTAVFSFLLLGEKLTPTGMAGAAIILLCVAAESRMGE